jgi:thymidylate synthase (FAD)
MTLVWSFQTPPRERHIDEVTVTNANDPSPQHADLEESSVLAGTERLRRCVVPALDEILGSRLRVLDDGFVRVIDYMGSDSSIVQAARVSYGAGTKKLAEDRALIRDLMRHRHTTPFEMCEIKLHVRAPIHAWRHWIRHRTANVNEYSTRDSIANFAHKTKASEWRTHPSKDKPLADAFLPVEKGQVLSARELELQKISRDVYQERMEAGVTREQARKDLPLSTYTEAYWKIDLHNLLNFLRVRMGQHAPPEIRCYAELIGEEVVSKWVPLAWDAFLDYTHNGLLLSGIEAQIVAALIAHSPEEAQKIAESAGLLTFRPDGAIVVSRERDELESKLLRLGLAPPWK